MTIAVDAPRGISRHSVATASRQETLLPFVPAVIVNVPLPTISLNLIRVKAISVPNAPPQVFRRPHHSTVTRDLLQMDRLMPSRVFAIEHVIHQINPAPWHRNCVTAEQRQNTQPKPSSTPKTVACHSQAFNF
jgi:hypothetical protein